MFKKLLIANRGEIACRVAATARRLGIKTVAVYSDADADAKHVDACDEAVPIGDSDPRESYLQWTRILEAARRTGAEAIHPGYGFLSENDEFAQACIDAGLTFIGPSPSSIQAMGLKAQSKQHMEAAGVPLVPGYHGASQEPELLRREAQRIGYPVLIKASAGGGGKGMRIVGGADEFEAALASCRREAAASFGNDAVLIEKYVQRPRHIEIQVFGDTHGNVIHLFERDCSVQRRHQKVLEEAPAPGLTPALRQAMGAAAVAAAKAVEYVGAGTVEFIVEQRDGGQMDFFFMEMNTRLQVEHPVTEAVTGLDLVEWQLRIASGEPLPLAQDQLRINGHAIEARVCAENPDNQFLPTTGRLDIYRTPVATSFQRADITGHGTAVRIDDGMRQGDLVAPFYDPMLGKLIVHGATRAQALARMDAALAEMHIVGLATNVQFLREVVRSPAFSSADLDTALIQREKDSLFKQEHVDARFAAALAVASCMQRERDQAVSPFEQRDGWRSHGPTTRTFEFEFLERRLTARLTRARVGDWALTIDDASGPFKWTLEADRLVVRYLGQRVAASVYMVDDTVHIFARQGATSIRLVDPLAHSGAEQTAAGGLGAPMPGRVVCYMVAVGDKVTKGQPLAIVEAMKMEHGIDAPRDGSVLELLYAPGEQVAEGAELLSLGE